MGRINDGKNEGNRFKNTHNYKGIKINKKGKADIKKK